MMRGALFSALASLGADDTRVLDLYAGTGALGIEALSRGAERCEFVERDRTMAGIIRENLEITGMSDRASVYVREVARSMGVLTGVFTLVLADPPYGDAAAWPELTSIAVSGLVDAHQGTIAVEHSSRMEALPALGGFHLKKTIRHGDSSVAIYGPSDDN
jgi:16S rRNA (guanine(966)-N(2))-methyltransferase RsmD